MFVLRSPFVRATQRSVFRIRSAAAAATTADFSGLSPKMRECEAEGEGMEMVLDLLGKPPVQPLEKPRAHLRAKVRPLAVRSADMLALNMARTARHAPANGSPAVAHGEPPPEQTANDSRSAAREPRRASEQVSRT